MKYPIRSLSTLVLVLGLSGCSLLMPGKKEFFQSKVPVYPEKLKLEEKQRQATQYVTEQLVVAHDEGLRADVTNSVMTPLGNALQVAVPLAASVGPPETPYKGGPTNLSRDLSYLQAKFDASLHRLETQLESLEGKKIEGTGLIQMGYFSYIALLFGIGAFLWFVLKIVAVFNPPVAIGTGVVSAGAALLRRGFGEVVTAGQEFKKMVVKQVESPELQQQVLDLFTQAHKQEQSKDVQTVIKTLISDPNSVPAAVKELKEN